MVIGFSVLWSQAATEKSAAVALFRHPRQQCAASPQARKRRWAVGGLRGLDSIQQFIRRDTETQTHDLLGMSESLFEVSRGKFSKSISADRRSHLSKFHDEDVKGETSFECSSYMDFSWERRVVACQEKIARGNLQADWLLPCLR